MKPHYTNTNNPIDFPKMNNRILELANQMFSMEQFEYAEEFINDEFMEKFGELIVCEIMKLCKQEWYDLNNAEPIENETARHIGYRNGKKQGVLMIMNKLKQNFGVTNES